MPLIICISSGESALGFEEAAEREAAGLAGGGTGVNSSQSRSSMERSRSRSSRSPEKAVGGSDPRPAASVRPVSEPADWCSRAGRSSEF